MILVKALSIIHTPIDPRSEVLRESDKSLQRNQDICYETQNGMRRFEVCAVVVELVVFDDDKASDGCENSDIVEGCVRVGALFLLLGSVRGLEDEDALDEEEEGGGIKELCSMR